MQIMIAKLQSLGNAWEHPYVDIKPFDDNAITDFLQSGWDLSWILNYEETLEDLSIDQIQLVCSVTYLERTQDRDTPRFTKTLLEDNLEWLDSVAFSSRDIYSGTETTNPKLTLDVPLRQFAEDFEDFKTNNPSETKFTKTYKIKLEVNLKREKWADPEQQKPELTKRGEVTLNLTIPTSSTIVTGDQPGTLSTIQLRGIKTGEINSIGSDINSLQYNYFTQNTTLEWNVFYNIAWDMYIPNVDLPAKLICDVNEFQIWEKIEDGVTKKVKEFSFTKSFDGDINSAHARKLQAYREKGFWKWWKRVKIFEPPWPLDFIMGHFMDNTALKPVGPYTKIFKWDLTIISENWPENRYPPIRLDIAIKVPQWKIDQMWRAYYGKAVGYGVGEGGYVLGSSIFWAGLFGIEPGTLPVYWFIPGGLIGTLIVIGAAIMIITLFVGWGIQAVSEHYSIQASTECSIDFDSSYNELYELKDSFENIHGLLEEIPDFMQVFFSSVNKILELSKAVITGFRRFLSALKEEDSEASMLQFNACQRWYVLIEGEILHVYNHKDQAITFGSKPPIPFDDVLLEILNGTTPLEIDEEKMKELENNPLLKELIINFKNMDKTKVDMDETKYNEFFEEFPDKMEEVYDGAVNAHLESLAKIKEIEKINNLRGSHLLVSLFNHGLISKEELEERIKRVGFNHNLLALMMFQFTTVGIKLLELEVFTTFDLLECCKTPKDRRNLAKALGREPNQEPYKILLWANLADLMRVEGVSEYVAKDLERVGVDTVVELSKRNPQNLYKTLQELWINRENFRPPPEKTIIRWIEDAKLLERMLEY